MSNVVDANPGQGWIDLTEAWAAASQKESEPVGDARPALLELQDDVGALMNFAVDSESYAATRRRIARLAVGEADRATVGAAVARMNANMALISHSLSA